MPIKYAPRELARPTLFNAIALATCGYHMGQEDAKHYHEQFSRTTQCPVHD